MAETIYQDFIHSVTLKRTSASAKRYDFSFGGSEDFAKHWRVSVDFENGKTFVAKEDETVLKQIDCALEDDIEYRVSILVNDGLCKVYLGEENVADLVLALDGYEGGRIKTNLEESGLIHSNESMTSLTTLWGDIYCGPYEVKKVINRLARSIGHLQSVKRMVENGVDCSDVLIQLAAVRAELNNAGKVLLKQHLEHCIADAIEENDTAAIDKMNSAIDKFMK